MSDNEPIQLVFGSHVRVAGEVVVGEVHLNYPLLQKEKVEEVHVKLRGTTKTYVSVLPLLQALMDSKSLSVIGSRIQRRSGGRGFNNQSHPFQQNHQFNQLNQLNQFNPTNQFNQFGQFNQPNTQFNQYDGQTLSGSQTSSRTQTEDLIHETVSLWQQGKGSYPPPGTHTLKLVFQFTLPDRLPPSFSYRELNERCDVGYFVEVVGQRPGLRFNKRILIPFPVLPTSLHGAEARQALLSGWQGPWRTFDTEGKIRRGIWGDYSHVKMTVRI